MGVGLANQLAEGAGTVETRMHIHRQDLAIDAHQVRDARIQCVATLQHTLREADPDYRIAR